ncbi:MAG: hypothetical protein KKG13_02990, partial [Nanoarchaeota archaeon]|nr:hypothetical protein [Nanoarchaeota archaeon]
MVSYVDNLNNEILTYDSVEDYELILEKEELIKNYNDCKYTYNSLKTYITILQNELQTGYNNFEIKSIVSDAKSLYNSQIEGICPELSSNAKSKLICSDLRFELVDILNNIKTSIDDSHTVHQYLEDSKTKYDEMEVAGCN